MHNETNTKKTLITILSKFLLIGSKSQHWSDGKNQLVLFLCMLYIVAESKLLSIIRILNFQRAKSLPCQGMRAAPLFPSYILGLLLKYHCRKHSCLILVSPAEGHRFFDRHCQLNTFQQLLQFSVYNKMLSEAAESEHILCVVHNSGYLLLEYEWSHYIFMVIVKESNFPTLEFPSCLSNST
jgi:hypothetical protein